MATELLREYDFEGEIQNCIKTDCGCGAEKIFSFRKIKSRERLACPACGCVSTFSAAWIDKTDKEFNS